MTAIWLALVGAMLLAISMASSGPAQTKLMAEVEADAIAIQLYGYSDAVNDYINGGNTIAPDSAPPGFCGITPAPCLTAPYGLNASTLPPAGWSGVVDAKGNFYIYSTATPPARIIDALLRMGSGTVFIGKCVNNSGSRDLVSAVYIDNSNTPLLTGIPNVISYGAVVLVGRHG